MASDDDLEEAVDEEPLVELAEDTSPEEVLSSDEQISESAAPIEQVVQIARISKTTEPVIEIGEDRVEREPQKQSIQELDTEEVSEQVIQADTQQHVAPEVQEVSVVATPQLLPNEGSDSVPVQDEDSEKPASPKIKPTETTLALQSDIPAFSIISPNQENPEGTENRLSALIHLVVSDVREKISELAHRGEDQSDAEMVPASRENVQPTFNELLSEGGEIVLVDMRPDHDQLSHAISLEGIQPKNEITPKSESIQIVQQGETITLGLSPATPESQSMQPETTKVRPITSLEDAIAAFVMVERMLIKQREPEGLEKTFGVKTGRSQRRKETNIHQAHKRELTRETPQEAMALEASLPGELVSTIVIQVSQELLSIIEQTKSEVDEDERKLSPRKREKTPKTQLITIVSGQKEITIDAATVTRLVQELRKSHSQEAAMQLIDDIKIFEELGLHPSDYQYGSTDEFYLICPLLQSVITDIDAQFTLSQSYLREKSLSYNFV